MRIRTTVTAVLACGTMMLATGCMVAAAGAGAGAAVLYNDRGVSTKMEGTVDGVFARAQTVFREMGITETARDNDDTGRERELQGRSGDLEVTVDIKEVDGSMVSVEVFAQRSTVNWDRDYARSVLRRIMSGR